MNGSLPFGLAAACAVLSAIGVVRAANLVHAVLWLAVALLATAVLYAMLGASFLAGVQVLLYVGGVVTLMVFGVMITRRHDGAAPESPGARPWLGALVAGGLFALVAAAVETTDGLDAPAARLPAAAPADLGRALLGPHVLAFEVVSVLLLGAMIGAIVIARKRDPGRVQP
jgi:NADH-quinone oxidoreductase subunit J